VLRGLLADAGLSTDAVSEGAGGLTVAVARKVALPVAAGPERC